MKSKELSTIRCARAKQLIITVRQTQAAWMKCGLALIEIKNDKLWVDLGYGSFEELCRKEFGWGNKRAYQIMSAVRVVKALPDKELSTIVETESQARALAKAAPEKDRPELLRKVVAGGSVTARRITEVADQSRNAIRETKPEMVRDDTGYVVPERAMQFWNRKSEAKEILKSMSDLRCTIRDLDKDDPMWCEVNFNAVLSELNNAYNAFAVAVPYAVCPTCSGQQAKTCTLCKGRGTISKFRFDHAVPRELKKIRAKACAT
jgi:hypothetical protein